MKIPRWLVVGVVVVVFGAYLGVRIHRKVSFKPAPSIRQMQAEQGVPVEVVQVEPTIFTTSISVIGRVVSEEEAAISPKYGGRIVSFPKEIGDTVRTGETLAVFDTVQLELQRAQAVNQVAVAEKGVAQAKVEMDDAAKDVARMERLLGAE